MAGKKKVGVCGGKERRGSCFFAVPPDERKGGGGARGFALQHGVVSLIDEPHTHPERGLDSLSLPLFLHLSSLFAGLGCLAVRWHA